MAAILGISIWNHYSLYRKPSFNDKANRIIRFLSFKRTVVRMSLSTPSSARSKTRIPVGRQLALHGIHLLLTNQSEAAETIFSAHKDDCSQLRMGYCFLVFMNALITFEDEKISLAQTVLKDTENKLAHEVSTFQSMKRMVFGATSDGEGNREQRLEEQIAIADCQVCMAILVFLRQDISSYIRGGWILRKAWRIYDRTYKEIKGLYDELFSAKSQTSVPSAVSSAGSSVVDLTKIDTWLSIEDDEFVDDPAIYKPKIPTIKPSSSSSSPSSSPSSSKLTRDIVGQLLASVSFGYGILQLCASLLPPNLLKIVNFLGFNSDTDTAIDYMMYARKGLDIRAPFATLGLLWYHTILRPFFSIDGNNISAGVEAAESLLQERATSFGDGALFLFYRARIERQKGNLNEALNIYEQATSASNQREVQLLCVHEMGWCFMLQFNWKEACKAFLKLKNESRWAKSYYAYLVSVSHGILNKIAECHKALAEIPSLLKRKSSQLEAFVFRRSNRLLKENASRQELLLCGMELIYLWHTIPLCSQETKALMLDECVKIGSKKLLPMRYLIEGALHNEIGNRDLAIQCLEECLSRSGDVKEEIHIPPFATYELSMILLQDSRTFRRGKALLTHVKDDFKGYDFENRLSVRIHAAYRNLQPSSSRNVRSSRSAARQIK